MRIQSGSVQCARIQCGRNQCAFDVQCGQAFRIGQPKAYFERWKLFPLKSGCWVSVFFVSLSFLSVCLCSLVRSLLMYTFTPESFARLAVTGVLSKCEPSVIKISLGLLFSLAFFPSLHAWVMFTDVNSICAQKFTQQSWGIFILLFFVKTHH